VTATLVSDDYPYLQVSCRVGNTQLRGRAYLDTGFDGGLVVPVNEMGLAPVRLTPIELGDGSLTWLPESRGEIEIGAARFRANVLFAGEEYLLGREVLDRMRVCFDRGKRLEIEF
jgi:predicted aspartyl protease